MSDEYDEIRLKGVRARGFHGVFDSEREEGQEFVADVTVWLAPGAGSSDNFEWTLDYGALGATVHDILGGVPHRLIETVAARIADAVLEHPLAREVEVTIHKPSAPVPVPFGDVAVRIKRRSAVTAFLALGSNMGESTAIIEQALRALDQVDGIRVLVTSSLYASAPEGGLDEPDYVNAVAEISTTFTPKGLLRACQTIERELGRDRTVHSRTLDIDIVHIIGETLARGALTLPHPRAHTRGFVMIPWAEIDPDAYVPGVGLVRDVAASLPADSVRRMG